MSEESQVQEPCLFSAKVESVGVVASLLKALAFCDKVNLFANETGLKFTVEEGKYVQASILLPKALFQEFVVNEEEVFFKIPLKELLECLKIFGSDGKSNDTTIDNLFSTSLNIVYKKHGSPLEILLEESGMITDIELKTEDIDDLMEFDIEPVQCKVVMKSDGFFELLSEVDSNSPEVIEICVIPMTHVVVISGRGVSGLMEVIIPAEADVVEMFECKEECKSRYKLSILKYAFRALQIGQKVALKMNPGGILSLSFIISNKSDSFVEFFCIPLHGEDPEDGLD